VDETHGATDRKRAHHLEMQNSPSVAYHADAYQEYITEEWVSSERQAFMSSMIPAQLPHHDPPDEMPPSVEQPYDAMSAGAFTGAREPVKDICHFFSAGKHCRYGDRCRFRHTFEPTRGKFQSRMSNKQVVRNK